jgi:hypothetical protein
MSDRPVFLCAAVYDEIADAEADYEAVFDLHAAGAIGTFDSAVVFGSSAAAPTVTKLRAGPGGPQGGGRAALRPLRAGRRCRRRAER